MRNELSGVVILDKPANMSSAQALSKVKRVLGARKAGHAGTLDPFATGVLICCINQATRLAHFFLHGDKTYEAVLRLGVETDTQDMTGRVTRQADLPTITNERLASVVKGFEGEQLQLPPVYAALKHEGTPIYKLARQGKPVQKPARSVVVRAIDVTKIKLPEIHFRVSCSSGTYVRTLCADMGAAIGCGGHLAQLRRTASSSFTSESAHTLEALEAIASSRRQSEVLIPMATAISHMPTFIANANVLQDVAHGRKMDRSKIPPALVQRPSDNTMADHLKVVDADLNLKAVLKISPDGAAYDYCCVFH
ncbi:MAG: tRNA pseudouridine(55) synthase TruB [Desulfobacteraceae bacterium]|jgi:tRNA pseudouridine55 synthase